MKFKYVGQAGFKDLDLTIAGITKPQDVLLPNTIIEVTDPTLIKRLQINGNYEVVQEKPRPRPKYNFKKKIEEKEEEEE